MYFATVHHVAYITTHTRSDQYDLCSDLCEGSISAELKAREVTHHARKKKSISPRHIGYTVGNQHNYNILEG
jgi:hypothetical protein